MNYLKQSSKPKEKRPYQKNVEKEMDTDKKEEISDTDLDELVSGL